MSATRDKTQKFTFVYSNLYQLYQKGKTNAAQANPVQDFGQGLATARVLKAADANSAVKINDYNPAQLLQKRVVSVPKPQIIAGPNEALEGLKDNLRSLNDLHSRLRVMLKELEDLIKD
ncbi:MAG: hypothetical protein A3K03_07350 [Bdellovibrionales bacterium RIFOXYD1_FULL_44_7]|nr:MAG: hypothetical protein A3K03_07350 [Bdellovibrionales bacterium RIFOXYD1_FULL_44_7]